MLITVVTSKPITICGKYCNDFRCGDTFTVADDTTEITIASDLTINLAEIRAAYKNLRHIVICDDVRATTYKSCLGEWRTQRLAFMYYSLKGDAFIAGQAYVLRQSRLWIIIVIMLLAVIIFVVLGAVIYYAYKKFGNKNGY